MMIAASATLDFVLVLIPSNSCTNNNENKEREKREGKIINNVFPTILPPKSKSFRLLFCRVRSDRTDCSATAIWTVCLSSIINIRAWMRGGREFDGDDDGWRRLLWCGSRLPMQLPSHSSHACQSQLKLTERTKQLAKRKGRTKKPTRNAYTKKESTFEYYD